jgi:hypothetical protein
MTEPFDLLAAATQRVNATPELQPYRDLLLEYPWPNMAAHLVWVAYSGEVAEIQGWAEACRRDEAAEGEKT